MAASSSGNPSVLRRSSLGYVAPPVAPPSNCAETQALFDSWAKNYNAEMKAWGYTAPKRMAEMLLAAKLHTGSRILDIGCGTGLSGIALHDVNIGSSGGIVGVDVSDECLDHAFAAKVYQDTKLLNLEEPWPFPDGCFDAVVAVGTSQYIEDFPHLYAEMCRVAKVGGLLAWTSLEHLWSANDHDCASAATYYAEACRWRQVRFDPPLPYTPMMPAKEDPLGAEHTYHLIVYRRLPKDFEAEEMERRKKEQKRLKRENNVDAIEQVREKREEVRQAEEQHAKWEREVTSFQQKSSRASVEAMES